MAQDGTGNGPELQKYRLGKLEDRVDALDELLKALDRRATLMLDQIEAEAKDRHELSRGLVYGGIMLLGSGIVSGLILPLILKAFFHQ